MVVMSSHLVMCHMLWDEMVKHKNWHTGLGNMLIVQQKVVWNYSVPTIIIPLVTTPPSPSRLSLCLKYILMSTFTWYLLAG